MKSRIIVSWLWCLVCHIHLASAVSTIDSSMKHSIEIRVIVDKHAFNQWKAKVDSSLSETAKKTETGRQMDRYINAVFQGLNEIFKGLLPSGISLDARIVGGIEYITTESVTKETFWGSGKGNSGAMIRDLQTFVEAKTYSTVDHTLLFTGLDIVDDTGSPIVAGVANRGAMCSSLSYSIVEAKPNGGAVTTLAHEVGHSLGCRHDGEGNTCPTNSDNIMEAHHEGNSTENFRFSACSVTYIRDFMLTLYNSYQGNCLTVANTQAPAISSQPLGKLYGPDEVCRRTFGEGSYVCRSLFGPQDTPYSTMCSAIWCSTLDRAGRCRSVTSADGFTCGKDKECALGFCKPSSTRHAVKDTCPLGDNPSYGRVGATSKTCSEFLTSGGCYHDVVKRGCCESCDTSKTATAGCEYGDKADWCATMDYPIQCYANDHVCCASCPRHVKSSLPAGCKYGDKASWCKTLEARDCYANDAACCETCAKFKDASLPEGCKYGDKASGCKTLSAFDCSLNKQVCCGTCAK